jgi:hypothetical protein
MYIFRKNQKGVKEEKSLYSFVFNEDKINKKCRKFKQFPAFFGRGDGDRTRHPLKI